MRIASDKRQVDVLLERKNLLRHAVSKTLNVFTFSVVMIVLFIGGREKMLVGCVNAHFVLYSVTSSSCRRLRRGVDSARWRVTDLSRRPGGLILRVCARDG